MSGFDTEFYPEFDAELYLRLCGERSLLAREQSTPWHSPVTERARALVAVGAIATPLAQSVVDDYARALAIRGLGVGPRPGRSPQRTAPPPTTAFAPPRVVPIDRVFEQPWGELTLRYLSLSDTDTRLVVTLRPAPLQPPAPGRPAAARRHAGPRSSAFAGGPPTLTITDDRGTVAQLGFSGGGNDELWRGHYSSQQTVAPDTGWVELFGERIDLPHPAHLGEGASSASVRIESLAEADPARRHLEHCLEVLLSDRRPRGGSLEEAIEALTTCGALAPTSELIVEARAVAEAMQPMGGRPSASGAGLPPRWQSLLARRGSGAGPVGTVLIGAATPLFDNISVAVLELDSTSDGFQVDLEIAGTAPAPHRHIASLDSAELTYSARDERGNHYLGTVSGSSGGGNRHDVQVGFRPGLDPNATHLDLAFTTSGVRALVGVALSWDTPT